MKGGNLVGVENLTGEYEINKLQHWKCFVRYLRTRCFCIRKLSRSFSDTQQRALFPWSTLYIVQALHVYIYY